MIKTTSLIPLLFYMMYNHKKMLSFIICFFILNISYSEDFKKYSDTNKKISISFPKNWQTEFTSEALDLGEVFLSSVGNIENITENEKIIDVICEITILDSTQSEKYHYFYNELNYRNFSKHAGKDTVFNKHIRNGFANYNIITQYSQIPILHNRDYYSEVTYKFFFCYNKSVFLLSCSCPKDKLNKYKPIFIQIANSVDFD